MIRKTVDFFVPQQKKTGIISALLAILTIAAAGIPYMRHFYAMTPAYEELVAGYSTWTGYYKQGDMSTAYFVLFGVIGLFFVYSAICNLLAKKLPVLKDKASSVFSEKSFSLYEKLKETFCIILFLWFDAAIVLRVAELLMPAAGRIISKGFIYGMLLIALAVIAYAVLETKKNVPLSCRKILFLAQLPLPAVFPLIGLYLYTYRGTALRQYFSPALVLVLTVIGIALFAYLLVQKKKQGDVGLFLSSYLATAVFAAYQLPKGTISGTPLEFYHYGELSVPLHQLLSFRTIPYIDTMPIHGVCDYFQAAIGYAFFGGKYAGFEAAMMLGCVVIAVITAWIAWKFLGNKFSALLLVLFFTLFGDQYYYVRWAFVLPFILIVFSEHCRKDFGAMLWHWVLLSILSIAWNPSIGGACALAMFPMILWCFFVQKGYLFIPKLFREKDYRRKWLPAYIFLLLLGLSFVPMFFKILGYISQNSEAILETTGDMLKEELADPFVWYASFGFMIPILGGFLFAADKEREKSAFPVFGAIFLVIFQAVIIRYTFVRTQYGERGIIAVTVSNLLLLMMFLIPEAARSRRKSVVIASVLLMTLTIFTKGANLLKVPASLVEISEIPDDYVLADGDAEQIPGLGALYMDPALLDELRDLSYVANTVCTENVSFVDMTNQLAHFCILDKKVLLPFSSTYNTNNETMQTVAIDVLEELAPDVIVVGPCWEHDSASLSTRNYHLYQYLSHRDYVPRKYGSCIFLTRNAKIAAAFEQADEEYAALMHVDDVQKLPLLWGSDAIREKYIFETKNGEAALIDTNAQETANGWILGEDTFFFYALEEPLDGKTVDFLNLTVTSPEGELPKYQCVVYFMQEGEGLKDAHHMMLDGGSGCMRIPVSTSPNWTESSGIATLMIDFISPELAGREISFTLSEERYSGIGVMRDRRLADRTEALKGKEIDLILFMGQSNMSGAYGDASLAPVLTEDAGYEYKAVSAPDVILPLSEPFGACEDRPGALDDREILERKGSMVTAFVNAYYAKTGTPVIAVSASRGSSPISSWQDRLSDDAMSRLSACRNHLAANGIPVRHTYMVWMQGETDAAREISPEDYISGMEELGNEWKAEGIEKCFLIQIGNGDADGYNLPIQEAQLKLCAGNDFFEAASVLPSALDDYRDELCLHYNQEALNLIGEDVGIYAGSYVCEAE